MIAPQVSLGMPVYNGERYMRAALDSLLAQTYRNFEIVIVDNASTDATREIGQRYARLDERIRYYRNDHNIGAAPNFNRTFELARGTYFKWAAHDDLCAPTFLERMVQVLESDPDIVLAHARVQIIGADDGFLDQYPATHIDTASHDVAVRLRAVMSSIHECFEVFGLIRTSALRQTHLMGRFPAGDKALLAGLALLGRFVQVPDFAFLSRDHPSRYSRAGLCGQVDAALKRESLRRRTAWFDPATGAHIVFPQWRFLRECARAVNTSPLSTVDQLRCHRELVRWMRWFWPILSRDVPIGVQEMGSRVASRLIGRTRPA